MEIEMRDFIEFIEFFAPFFLIILSISLVVGGLMLGANYWESYKCGNYEEVTGKATKWIFMDECYVQTDAGWQRWDEYKDRAIASEGLKAAP